MEEIQKKISEDISQIYYIATDKRHKINHYYEIFDETLRSVDNPCKNRILYRAGNYYYRSVNGEVHELDIHKLSLYPGTMRIICKVAYNADRNLSDYFDQMNSIEFVQPKFTKKQLGFYCVPERLSTFAILPEHRAEFLNRCSSISAQARLLFDGVITYKEGKMYLQLVVGEPEQVTEKDCDWYFEDFILLY